MHYVMGDIHNDVDKLQSVLKQIDITKDDELFIPDVRSQVKSAMEGKPFTIVNKTKDYSFEAYANISSRQADMLLAGGLLNYTRNN